MTDNTTTPKVRQVRTGAAVGIAIAAAVAAVAPFTTGWEGTRLKTYLDPIKKPTYCTGETQNVDWTRVYTKTECAGLLRKRLAHDYAPAILQCVPGLVDRPKAFQASLDASYNTGPAGFCRSPMARAFNAGQWAKGCDAFAGWYTTARGVKLPGLVKRRAGERLLCREGL